MVIFSGVHVNPENLPIIMLKLKPFIPMSHAIEGLRLITSSGPGIPWGELFLHVGLELLMGVGYLAVGFISFSLIEKIAIKAGRLDLSS